MPITTDITVGDHFKVYRTDGKQCNIFLKCLTFNLDPAVIVETRSIGSGELEYFVHYIDFDRRLDEWVARDRIDLKSKFTRPPQTEDALLQRDHNVGRLTRHQKRRLEELNGTPTDENSVDPIIERLEREHLEFTKVKLIDQIRFGKYEIGTWYFSPYPDEYRSQKYLWICEFCLKYMKLEKTWVRHVLHECRRREPPGRQIYSKGNIRVFEVDASEQKLYCQNLCLLAKLFLDHKTLYFDVMPFLFYVLCEVDESGCHLVGYFSKERVSAENNNLACILTLPPFQRKGYGRFLITLSYELAKLQGMIGSPEKPLSDLGRLSYKSYWEDVLFHHLLAHPETTIEELSATTYIAQEDIVWTLQTHDAVPYWHHGRHMELSRPLLSEFVAKLDQKRHQKVLDAGVIEFDASSLRWMPLKAKSSSGATTKM